ncbi:MAG: alpha/beta hydrolase [Anaerolineae bacterium]|nr:alpha/beta hydrolase [Phycisphaerae bacterium]
MPSITLDHATIHYTERGGGQNCLVLVHGFPLDSRMWDRALNDPLGNTRVITPDLPGFGKSSTDRPFTMHSLAEDLSQFLSCINANNCVLGGFSMGGYVALAYAKKFPKTLRGLMLIDTRAEADSAEGKEKRNKMIQTVRTSGSRAIAEAMLPNMVTKEHASDPSIAKPLSEMMESCSPTTIEYALTAMREREDQTAFLPSIAMPTLLVVGEDDAITPKSAAEAMNKAIPRSQLVVIPNAGHVSPMENPQAVDRAIRQFVASI